MASLQWARLLETCCRRDASDLLLTVGSPPMIRLRESWRALQVPPLDVAALQVLAEERLGTRPDGEADGFAYSHFRYGDAGFRAMAFGYPDTKLLLVAKYPGDDEGAQRQGAAV